MKITLNEFWLHGKYHWFTYHNKRKLNKMEAEINNNNNIPYISVGTFFAQGDDAVVFIDQVHKIWLKGRCSVKTAIKKWANTYLSEY